MKTIQTQPAQSSNPVEPQSLIQHGDSPTAIILEIAILLATLFRSMAGLMTIILKQHK